MRMSELLARAAVLLHSEEKRRDKREGRLHRLFVRKRYTSVHIPNKIRKRFGMAERHLD